MGNLNLGAGQVKADQWVNNDGTENYKCRAWVNFNGTDTVAIRASGNVSSITDGGVGLYTVNFTTAMSDANYAVAGFEMGNVANRVNSVIVSSAHTSSDLYVAAFNPGANAVFDSTDVTVTVFR